MPAASGARSRAQRMRFGSYGAVQHYRESSAIGPLECLGEDPVGPVILHTASTILLREFASEAKNGGIIEAKGHPGGTSIFRRSGIRRQHRSMRAGR